MSVEECIALMYPIYNFLSVRWCEYVSTVPRTTSEVQLVENIPAMKFLVQ